jgi:hypothetical protein
MSDSRIKKHILGPNPKSPMRSELMRYDIRYTLDLLDEERQMELRRAPAARPAQDDDANRLERIQGQMDDVRNPEIREGDHLEL